MTPEQQREWDDRITAHIRHHRQGVEQMLAKLVVDGHLIDDMEMHEEMEDDGHIVRLVTRVIHKPSGRVLSTVN